MVYRNQQKRPVALTLCSRLLLRFSSFIVLLHFFSCFLFLFFFSPPVSICFHYYAFLVQMMNNIRFSHSFLFFYSCPLSLTGTLMPMAETPLVGDAYACSDVYSSSSAEPSTRNSMPIGADVVVEQGAHNLVRGAFSRCSRLGHNRGRFCREFVECQRSSEGFVYYC